MSNNEEMQYDSYGLCINSLLSTDKLIKVTEEKPKLIEPVPIAIVSDEETNSKSDKTYDSFPLLKKKTVSYRMKRGRRTNFNKCLLCPVSDCQALFETKEELDTHQTEKHKKLYHCSYKKCKETFMDPTRLDKHLKRHFLKKKEFACPFPGCEKKFTERFNLNIHYRVHTGERPFECKICHNEYYDRANYKYHIKTAHKLKESDRRCKHANCEMYFKTKRNKIYHHNICEKECKEEKKNLIQLASLIKSSCMDIINGIGVDTGKKRIKKKIKNLKEQEDILKTTIVEDSIYEKLFDKGINI